MIYSTEQIDRLFTSKYKFGRHIDSIIHEENIFFSKYKIIY